MSWIVACTSHNNGKSLYYQLLNAKYGKETSTAINKLWKAGISGKIDNIRIARAFSQKQQVQNIKEDILAKKAAEVLQQSLQCIAAE